MSNPQVEALGERFKNRNNRKDTPTTTESELEQPAKLKVSRKTQALYLDPVLMRQVDKQFKEFNHHLYPKEVSKSAFLESFFRYGLQHLDELEKLLVDTD